mgnify:CR=1 FL=1
MKTIILKYNDRNELANNMVESLKAAGIFTVVEKSPYNKDFVRKIQESRKSKGVVIKTTDLWK